MINTIQSFFKEHLARLHDDPGTAPESDYRLAAAALLMEMTRADAEVSAVERSGVERALQQAFELDAGELAELIRMAEAERDAATCLFGFTRAINEGLEHAQKVHIVELLWQVAHADGDVDRYEDHLARKVADLLYLSHAEFIGAKLRAEAAAGAS